ncbi:hypothetical protein [Streptomyces hundungensis]|uniref:hypothetical protein n=1 Tax=Streptomyces hundungensis TaxID=1077946 RepID=UPI0033CAE937
MTSASWFTLALCISCWAPVFLGMLFSRALRRRPSVLRASPPESEPGLFAEDYLRSLDEPHDAVSAAAPEPRPGVVSADLDECWSIWRAGSDDGPA